MRVLRRIVFQRVSESSEFDIKKGRLQTRILPKGGSQKSNLGDEDIQIMLERALGFCVICTQRHTSSTQKICAPQNATFGGTPPKIDTI